MDYPKNRTDPNDPLIKLVQCNLGNIHRIACVSNHMEPFDCNGICLKKDEPEKGSSDADVSTL